MRASDIPSRFPIPFANAAGGAYIRDIPTASQIGVTDGRASLTDGFPPLNFTPVAGGGVPPDGRDFNDILFRVSGWSRWQAAGGPVTYNAQFATDVGGYPSGAFLQSRNTPGLFYVSTTDNNGTDPESIGSAGWLTIIPTKATEPLIVEGLNDASYITPLGLAGLRASAAEVVAGTDVAKYVTPASLGALAKSFTAPGYRENSDGSIDQWGQANSGGDNAYATYAFPIPFPNACLSIVGNSAEVHGAATTGNEISCRFISPIQFQIGSDDTVRLCNWRALGF
jgi:hypothetical protein